MMTAISPPKKNKVLLIHPLGYAAAAAGDDILRLSNTMPPLGLASLAAWLEKHEVDVEIIDCFGQPAPDSLISSRLQETRPDFVGLTCTTSSFPDAARIIKLIKQISPKIHTILGGPHASTLKEKIMRLEPAVDFVIVGEGETPLLELAQKQARELATIPGLCWRTPEGEIVFNGYQSQLPDLDMLPFPAYHKLPGYPSAYTLPIFNYPAAPNASCISSRGCPYQCSYCDRSVFRQSFRCNSAAYLYQHLKYMRDRWGIRHINFYDDQFTLHRERVTEFCRLLIDNPLEMTFNCAVRAEHIDFELLQMMKAAGCWMISLGIETGDPELLARHRQNTDLELLAQRVREIKQAGIRTKGLLMIGLPGETENSVRKSMEYVFSLPIDDFNLAKFTPFPGSPLYQKIKQYGEFSEDWEKMDCMNFVFIPQNMTKQQLERLFRQFYRRHFLRPRTIWGYTAMIWRSPDSWRRFWKNAGGFLRFAFSNQRIRSRKSAQ